MRTRLREEPPIYEGTRDNFSWADHAMRTLVTGSMISTIGPETLCDPACGDASVLEAAFVHRRFEFAHLMDISQAQIDVIAPSFPHHKQRDDVNGALERIQVVDMVVLTEILEHLPEPDITLRLARLKGRFLVASSPIGDPEDGRNHEHLWAWDEDGYREMLEGEGWEPIALTRLTYPGTPWTCQIWMAR